MAPRPILFLLGIAMLLNDLSASPEGKAIVPEKYKYENPASWGSLSPDFAPCSSGMRQSPINIVEVESIDDKTLGPLKRKYRLVNATLTTNGLEIQVKPQGEGFLIIDGKTYNLVNIHWHTPSEHRVNGIQYPAEIHQVHEAADGSLAAIGILCSYGKPNPLVTRLEATLNALPKKTCVDKVEDHIYLGHFDNKLLRPMSGKYFKYYGSLTTPPCLEKVTWIVMVEVRTISMKQVAALKAPLCQSNKNNTRPVQPLNGRKVQRYGGQAKKQKKAV
ncbi:hypothetical protein Ancab_031623 [Ancistrocladus abbreviatus]